MCNHTQYSFAPVAGPGALEYICQACAKRSTEGRDDGSAFEALLYHEVSSARARNISEPRLPWTLSREADELLRALIYPFGIKIPQGSPPRRRLILTQAVVMTSTVTIPRDSSLIYYHGRWDSDNASWWAGTGFKLNIRDLTSLTLTLGPNTTTPYTNLGVSIDYGPYKQLQVRQGENEIPLGAASGKESGSDTIVRIVVQGWENNRVVLENIKVNEGAELLPYTPQKLVLQFIGDSLCSGQYFQEGINQAWTFLVGERFKAETRINAQPGIALTDVESWGNPRGQIFQFFQTEDPGYSRSKHHNYTTPWDFEKDTPQPSVIVVHLGANDRGQKVTPEVFLQSLKEFLAHLREIYTDQPILLFTPWGWPQPDGSNDLYYRSQYDEAYAFRRAAGDSNLHLIDGAGWLAFEDFDPENTHPSVAGDQKIAGLFEDWLKRFGLQPEEKWATTVKA